MATQLQAGMVAELLRAVGLDASCKTEKQVGIGTTGDCVVISTRQELRSWVLRGIGQWTLLERDQTGMAVGLVPLGDRPATVGDNPRRTAFRVLAALAHRLASDFSANGLQPVTRKTDPLLVRLGG